MYEIPLKPVPVQRTATEINGVLLEISLIPRLGRLYATVSADRRVLIRERLCRHGEPLVREAYRGLAGELYFIDTAGEEDPAWPELGSRYRLVYA
ncbi:hypothetical protein L1281_002263 [Neisseria sp. HSC-16F19]|nr:hypothetical protein [Neisseria sp. HSC-16F19]MCP2041652.1 hypothetical protein [Neisseria sp. HSC-16F19]